MEGGRERKGEEGRRREMRWERMQPPPPNYQFVQSKSF